MTHNIFVYSGKGGVGKTTVSVNLAYANMQINNETGLYDADIQGPNIGSMIGGLENSKPEFRNVEEIAPGNYGGVKANSMGLMFENEEDIYFHGKYLEGVFYQTLYKPDWDVKDLFMDLPPGTSEVHREIFDKLDGKTILVSTPQKNSYEDTKKSIEMLKKFDIDILGIVENLAYYRCDNCEEKHNIFPGNTVEKLVKEYDLNKLGSIPILEEFGHQNNKRRPYIVDNRGTETATKFRDISKKINSIYEDVKNIRPTSG